MWTQDGVMKMEKRSIWIPIKKNYETNEYRAILSDTSIDRDNERMSKNLLMKWANSPNKFIPMLMDHKNEIMKMVGQWTDPVLVENKSGSFALMMKPKWFLSNPNAQILKGMLDEGAELGLSIGAVPKKSQIVKSNDMDIREWTDAELLEASLTPIGSNRNSFINIAKSFGINENNTMAEELLHKNEELQEETLEEEVLEEDLDSEDSELEKGLLEEIASLRKELSALKKANNRKAVLKAHSENSEVASPVEAVKKNLSVWEQMAVLKGIKNYGEDW